MTLVSKALAEMIGTFTVIFVGGGSIVLTEKYPNLVPSFIIPLTWGLIIGLMILAVGGISGAHFNPAVTLAFAAAKRLPAVHVPVYWFSQCTGGLMAIGLLIFLRKL